MTQKGQVTIPAVIRSRLGLRPKDRMRFELDGDEVKLSPARSQLDDGFGAVAPRRRPEDWPDVKDTVQEKMAADVAAEC
ncbi:MAG: AbrB/MazE/SpoVT family DNA-binding domain-containing protein [Chloroflexota bacterium]|nr:AbrB/MazE/SpoVT family DNA-binding domain-containing protein [Chloroflexia bacterium]MDQ3227437.1 AbrB/MazE/SpoVT family DNA-binding domain-containing protein [Chloroflexota bacterium]